MARKMRILVNMISQFAGKPSGVAIVGFRLLEQLLVRTEHDYVLLSPWPREALPASLQGSRLEVVERARPRIVVANLFIDGLRMGRWCKNQSIDAMLNMDPFGSPAGGRRRVTIVHDLYFREIPENYSRRERFTNDLILRRMVSASDALVCVSDATRLLLEAQYPAAKGKAVTIHSASSLSANAGQAETSPPIGDPYVLAVGNATPNKNFGILGEAFDRLRSRNPALRLVHVGADPDGMLSAAMSPAGREAIVRARNLTDDQLAHYYRHAVALCIPSLTEGFCLPILEAQQMGCPVICSNQSAMPEIAGSGALLFDPRSPDALESNIRRLVDHPAERTALIDAGHDNLKRFSWPMAAERYAAILETTPPEARPIPQ